MSNHLTEFDELSEKFEKQFNVRRFPEKPESLYNAAQHLLSLKGKRVRPVLCLMANELFGPLMEDAFLAANAIELFHNFTLVHDDIMDKAPLRRGQPTVHELYGESTALLAGDVMLVQAYEYLSRIDTTYLPRVLSLFNDAAKKVCEGQQLDMEYESVSEVSMEDYVEMIALKTSVLLAASLQIGSVLGGAGVANQQNLFNFGKNLGIAFQIQDDYLDAFGDPKKFGKKTGGDIMSNKKTFLLLMAMNADHGSYSKAIDEALAINDESKIGRMIDIYKSCGVDESARELKKKFYHHALVALDDVAVVSTRKKPLMNLAIHLLDRDQ